MNQLPGYKKRTTEESKADIHNNKGVDFCIQNDFDNGIAEFGKALRANPNYPIAYYNRGMVFAELGLQNACLVDMNTVRILMGDFRKQRDWADEISPNFLEIVEGHFSISTRR